jgi:hypothetical protein
MIKYIYEFCLSTLLGTAVPRCKCENEWPPGWAPLVTALAAIVSTSSLLY